MSLKQAKRIAKLLDGQFEIFGFKFGIDPLLGLVPGMGEIISFLLAIYVIKAGYEVNLPQTKINQMFVNVVLDLLIGAVPLLGDVADFWFKASDKNIKIIEDYLKTKESKVEEGEIIP